MTGPSMAPRVRYLHTLAACLRRPDLGHLEHQLLQAATAPAPASTLAILLPTLDEQLPTAWRRDLAHDPRTCESAWIAWRGQVPSEPLAAVWERLGARPPADLPIDHISTELTLAATLLDREVHPEGGQFRPEAAESAWTRFMQAHVGWWAPMFARHLQGQRIHPFYRTVARLLEALDLEVEPTLDQPVPRHVVGPADGVVLMA